MCKSPTVRALVPYIGSMSISKTPSNLRTHRSWDRNPERLCVLKSGPAHSLQTPITVELDCDRALVNGFLGKMESTRTTAKSEKLRSARKHTSNTPQLAKLTPPRLQSVVERKRLFAALDGARQRPIIWVSSPAGSGKTTLLASYLNARKLTPLWYQIDAGDNDPASFFYHLALASRQCTSGRRRALPALTPEYLAGLPIFTRNFFRELFAGLPTSSMVVLDDYQEAGDGALLHSLLPHALDEIPAGLNVAVLSRSEPPISFSRLLASSRIASIRWNDMQLTETESIEVVSQRLEKQGSVDEIASRLHASARGWVA